MSDLVLQSQAKSLEYYLRTYFPRYGSAIEDVTAYTPTYLGASTAGTTTYSTQVGWYTRFGRRVDFNGRVIWTNATGTGTAIVSIPFTSDATANMRHTVGVYTTNVTFANGSVQAHIAPNTAFFVMLSPATNAAGTAIAVETAGDIIFSGFFYLPAP